MAELLALHEVRLIIETEDFGKAVGEIVVQRAFRLIERYAEDLEARVANGEKIIGGSVEVKLRTTPAFDAAIEKDELVELDVDETGLKRLRECRNAG